MIFGVKKLKMEMANNHRIEIDISDDHRNFEQSVLAGVESGHFAVHPDQFVRHLAFIEASNRAGNDSNN